MRRRWWWIAIACIAVGVAFVVAARQNGVPERVHACGREFGHEKGAVGAGPFRMDELQREAGAPVAKIKSIPGGREIWASEGCGLGVFVRVDDNRFLGYGLIGGP